MGSQRVCSQALNAFAITFDGRTLRDTPFA